MFKMFKNFTKKDWIIILVIIVFICGQVWLDLKLPDYMSEITKLIQTENSKMSEILSNGGMMMLCAFGSLVSTIFVGYLSANLSASFSR